MSYDISDMSDMPKWRRGAVGLSRHVILSSYMSDISDISEMSDMSDIPYTQNVRRPRRLAAAVANGRSRWGSEPYREDHGTPYVAQARCVSA